MNKWIWFMVGQDRCYPVFFRKAYKKARFRRKSERMAPGFWELNVKCRE